MNECVNINGKARPWTMGSYILHMKKSPRNIKLGVCYVVPEDNYDSEVDLPSMVSVSRLSHMFSCDFDYIDAYGYQGSSFLYIH